MRPHPRIRKTVKWGGAVVVVLLAVVWVGSGWCWVRYDTSGGGGGNVGRGWWALWHIPDFPPSSVGFYAGALQDPPAFMWWFDSQSWPGCWIVWIPLWVIVLPFAGAAAIAWRLDTLPRRRARVGLCPNCSYDRTGLAPASLCPECGAAANPAADHPT